MATGRVKWFNNAKGYGFVRPDEGGEDLFVHYSYIQMDGYKSLRAGQPVEYEVRPAEKGFHAVNLHPMASDSEPRKASASPAAASETGGSGASAPLAASSADDQGQGPGR